MKKFTTLTSIALVSATMVATPAMAQSNVAVAPVQKAQLVQLSNVNTQLSENIQASDLSYAFGNNQDLQMQQMTGQEMVETEGALIPALVYAMWWGAGAIVGGGVTLYGVHYICTNYYTCRIESK